MKTLILNAIVPCILETKVALDDKVWTAEEIRKKLGAQFKSASLLIPDDSFYAQITTKADVEKLATAIKNKLKIRQAVHIELSSDSHNTSCQQTAKHGFRITLSRTLMVHPLELAATVAHLLAHASLISQKLVHLDQSENEKLADYVTLLSGLGIVTLNGASRGGWRSYRHHAAPPYVLGYMSIDTYRSKLKQRLSSTSEHHSLIGATVAWERADLYGQDVVALEEPCFIKKSTLYHRNSQVSVAIICLFSIAASIFVAVALLQKPAYSNQQLSDLKNSALSLQNSYEGCKLRLEKLHNTLPDDFSSLRVISYEQGRCKSLENRYTSAVKAYNLERTK